MWLALESMPSLPNKIHAMSSLCSARMIEFISRWEAGEAKDVGVMGEGAGAGDSGLNEHSKCSGLD